MAARIAVIEDDEDVLDAMLMVLGKENWIVRPYTSGENFLADFEHNQPDCVILDPHLPGISGADLVRLLRASSASVQIVALTAQPDSPTTAAVIDTGVRTVLTKPVSAEELVRQVQAALQSRFVTS